MAEILGSLLIFLVIGIVPIAIAGYLSYGCNKNTIGIKKWIFIIVAALTWPYYLPYYVTFHWIFSDFAFCPIKKSGLNVGGNNIKITT